MPSAFTQTEFGQLIDDLHDGGAFDNWVDPEVFEPSVELDFSSFDSMIEDAARSLMHQYELEQQDEDWDEIPF